MAILVISLIAGLLFLPSLKGIPSLTGGGSSDTSVDTSTPNVDTDQSIAEYEFNMACGKAILQNGCPMSMITPVFPQCQKAYGNLTLEECRSKCCNSSSNEMGIGSFNLTG